MPGEMFACARQISYCSDWLMVGAEGWITTSPIPDRLWGHSSPLNNGNRRPLLLVKRSRSEAITYSQTVLRFGKRGGTPPIPHISIVTNQAQALVASHTVYSEINLLGMAANYHTVCVIHRIQSGHLPQLH